MSSSDMSLGPNILKEYQGTYPGCFECKKPILDTEDWYEVIWHGKTWQTSVFSHVRCLREIVEGFNLK